MKKIHMPHPTQLNVAGLSDEPEPARDYEQVEIRVPYSEVIKDGFDFTAHYPEGDTWWRTDEIRREGDDAILHFRRPITAI